MRLLLFTFLTIFPLWAQTSATLSTAQYRAIYSAAQLIEAADACELDWKPYHEAFVNAQKKKALAEGWSLGTQARATLQLREMRVGVAAQLPVKCSQERQDSLSIRLEVEKERLAAEADPDDDNWVLKPRGKNWLHITGTQPFLDNRIYEYSNREVSSHYIQTPLSNTLRANGRIKWIEQPPGAEKTYHKRWIAPQDGVVAPKAFLNLRPIFYHDESLAVLAQQVVHKHPVYKEAFRAYASGSPGTARKLLEDIEEDTFIRNSTEFWLLRAYLEYELKKTSKARKYLKSLALSTGRNAQTELLMRHLLVELGERSNSSNEIAYYHAMVMEIARDDRIEVLAFYSDGSALLAFSDGGGLVLESYKRERLIWDVQFSAIEILKDQRTLSQLGIYKNSSGEADFLLPPQGKLRLTLMDGRNQISKTFSSDTLEEISIGIWFKLNGLLNSLKKTYHAAEVDR